MQKNIFLVLFKYACGDTLPGDYFDADSMRKEVTFIGLYFNNPDEQEEEDEEMDECEKEDLANFERYKKDMDLTLDNPTTSVLRGFIVVKDLHNKEIFEEEGRS